VNLKQLKAAPIISLHLWFDRAITRRPFVGLLDTQVQWFFNRSAILASPQSRQGYVSTVISGAHAFVEWKDSRLLAMTLEEIRRLFPEARQAALLHSLVIKEHQATLSLTVGSEALRPAYQSPFPGLLLAGDWTKTGLPATIESACVSGHACADLIAQEPSISSSLIKEVAHA
jgi:zeta-carotene desaturase